MIGRSDRLKLSSISLRSCSFDSGRMLLPQVVFHSRMAGEISIAQMTFERSLARMLNEVSDQRIFVPKFQVTHLAFELLFRFVNPHVNGDVGDFGLAELALVVLLAGVLLSIVPEHPGQRREGLGAVRTLVDLGRARRVTFHVPDHS